MDCVNRQTHAAKRRAAEQQAERPKNGCQRGCRESHRELIHVIDQCILSAARHELATRARILTCLCRKNSLLPATKDHAASPSPPSTGVLYLQLLAQC